MYTDTLNRWLPSDHLSTLARAGVKERQVLIDKDPVVKQNHLDGLNEQELVAKANEALAYMADQLPQSPSQPRVVGARKLSNSGVVYELDKLETANWVRKEKNVFTAGFGGTAVMRERATSVIVEFVPVVHSPDVLTKNRRIEGESGLEEGVLLTMRWIKLMQRCSLGQRVADLIAQFKTNKAVYGLHVRKTQSCIC